MEILKNKFIKDIIATYAARFSGVVLALLTTIITTKNVGPEGRGWMACAFTLASFWCAAGSFGINISNLVLGAKWTDKRPQLAGNSLFISLASVLLLTLILTVLKSINPDLVPLPGIFFAGTVVYTLALSIYINLQSLLIAFGLVKICNIQEFAYKSGTFILTVVFCYLGFTTPGKFFAAAVLVVIITALWVIYAVLKAAASIRLSWEVFRQSLAFNIKSFSYTVFNNAFLMADVFFVQFLAGPAQTGLYNIALAVRNVMFMITTVVCQLLLPKTAAQYTVVRDSLPNILKTARILTVFNIMLSLLAVPLLPPVINAVLGPEFDESAFIVFWLLPGIVLFGNYSVLTLIYNLAGQPWNSTVYLAAACILDASLCIPLIKHGGAIGAAQAFSASSLFLLLTAYYQVYLYKHTDVGLTKIAEKQ